MAPAPTVVIGSLTASAAQARGAVVIIDVFRAFTTAAVALSNGAEAILMVDDLAAALSLRDQGAGSVCIGERVGRRPEGFDYGNSPDEIGGRSFKGEVVIQTTSNGTRAVMAAKAASSLYAASLVNAEAVVRDLLARGEPEIWLIPAGDGQGRTDEDELCALYMRALLRGRSPDRNAVRQAVAALSPRIDGETLSAEDLALCLDIDAVPVVVRIERRDGLCVARRG